MGEKPYVLRKELLHKFVRESPNHQVLCYRCDELLKVGDVIVSRSNSTRHGKMGIRKFYHEACWESMFIE